MSDENFENPEEGAKDVVTPFDSVGQFSVPTTPHNDFLQIASSAGAVVETQAVWEGLISSGLINGFPTGIVLQPQYNKAWRQATSWIRALGWHASQLTNQAAVDDGNSEKLWRQFFEGLLLAHLVYDNTNVNNYVSVNLFGLSWTSPPRSGTQVILHIPAPNTNVSTTCTFSFMGGTAFPIRHIGDANPQVGDLYGPVHLVFINSVWYIVAINEHMLIPRINNKDTTLTGDVTGTGKLTIPTTLRTANPTDHPGPWNTLTVNEKGLVTAGSNTAYLIGNQNIVITGDVDGSGTTAITLTLDTVNPTNFPGPWNTVTVNQKGLVVAGSNTAYLTGNQSITLSGDVVTFSGTTALTATLKDVNPNIGVFNNVSVTAKGLVISANNLPYLLGNQNIVISGDATGSGTTSIPLTIPRSIVAGKSFGTQVFIYNSPGPYTYTVPAGVILIQVVVVGGGGGSTDSDPAAPDNGACAGAGGGGCAISNFLTVSPGNTFGVVVGAGGAPTVFGLTGSNGGHSSFNGTIIGYGGAGSSHGSAGGPGGGVGGMFNIYGSPGTSYGTGLIGSAGGTGGTGGGPYGGGGGFTGTGIAGDGNFPGGGAGGPGSGGSIGYPGKTGASGAVMVIW